MSQRIAQRRPELPNWQLPVHNHTNPITGGALSVTTFAGGAGSGTGGGGGGGGAIAVSDEGSPLTAAVTSFDFVGSGVTASAVGDAVTVTVPGATALTIEDEGTPLETPADTLNFVGAGVTASGTGTTKTITIPGGSFVPTYIGPAETFTVPADRQALWAVPIDCDGTLDVVGTLVEVS